MTIDGTNISTYGLRLLRLEDYYNLPARKKILPVPEFTENDIKYTPKRPTVRLFGKYSSQSAMTTAMNDFITLLKSSQTHAINLVGHGITFTGVFRDGIKTTVRKNTIELRIRITVVA